MLKMLTSSVGESDCVKEETEMASDRDVEREEVFMDFSFRNFMVRFNLSMGAGVSMWKEMARWSEILVPKLELDMWLILVVVEQTRSRVWPLTWVGKSMY